MPVAPVLSLIRPKQWSKNLLVFAAPLFAARMGDPISAQRAGAAFLAMCLLSSGVYVANDWLDRDRDRAHPTKRLRPLAAGTVSPAAAAVLMIVLGGAGLGIGAALNMGSLKVMAAYAVLQLLYNLKLKHMPVADVFTVSSGFLLRAILGATAVWAPISGWLLFCTGALALMLGFAKRRSEFIAQADDRTASRESLAGYSRQSLDALVIMTAAGAAICYGIYSLESSTAHKFPGLIATNLFVLYGVARYVLLVFGEDEGAEPADLLFKDPHLWGAVALFVVTAVMALQGYKIPLVER